MIGHHKRHAFYNNTRWGATRDGREIAVEAAETTEGGAYMYTSGKVLGNATLLVTGAYEIENVKVDTRSVYTNHIPGGAFRGFGGPQAAFAAEMQMNKLAEALHIDPVELRARNIFREGSLLSVNTPLPAGVSMPEVLEKTAEVGGWQRTPDGWQHPKVKRAPDSPAHIRRGKGVAIGFKNVGFSFGAPEHCWATVELHGGARIERAVLRHAGAEVGQGSHTAFVQMAAEALQLPMDRIQLIAQDTAYTDNSGSVSASRMTFMAGNAIRGAAQAALVKWNAEERPAVAAYMYRPPATTAFDPQTGKSEPNFAYGYVGEVAEVEVDTETGQVRLLNVHCVDDVGKAINPQQVQGQVEGAVVQAAGYTLMEDFIEKGGRVLTPYLSNYLIPTVLDIPDSVQSHLLEYADPIGPWGARGMGEMPYLPLAAAIASAVHDATGVWMDEFPLTSERMFAALQAQAQDQR
jgi:CO/xanthine dehydrogenase Mo-binding subunit